MPGRVYLGTSGFAYGEWKGGFYPSNIRGDDMLGFYSTRFSSVEINYTFQREPSEATLTRWAADTPTEFAFALKAHRSITHSLRLGPKCDVPLAAFLERLVPLGPRAAVVLFQCPPTLKADLARLREFLAMLPEDRRYAFEFRHESWRDETVKRTLSERGAAWCLADTDSHDAPMKRTASGFAYLRLRKSIYDDVALSHWAKDIAETATEGADVYCYFKHEDGDGGRGVGYALRVQELLESG